MQACMNSYFHVRTVEIVEKDAEKPVMTRKQKYILKRVRMAERCLIECGSVIGIGILSYVAMECGLVAGVIALPISVGCLIFGGYHLRQFIDGYKRLKGKYERSI